MLPSESKANSAAAASTGLAVASCSEWLTWAAAQIEACVNSDELAMNELLASLADLMGSAPRTVTATPHNAAADGKLSAVIMAVQAHDRVMQGLTHVTESLRLLQGQLGDARQADSADSWRALREKQFRAFSMAEERALFARMVAHEDAPWREVGWIAGEAELFTTDDGLFES
jgi:hypothetical protein